MTYLCTKLVTMNNDQLRKIMIGVFFASIMVIVVASYILKDTPREGGYVNSGMRGDSQVQWKTETYPSGELRAEGNYQGFTKHGKWVYYEKNGDTLLIEYYDKGKVIPKP